VYKTLNSNIYNFLLLTFLAFCYPIIFYVANNPNRFDFLAAFLSFLGIVFCYLVILTVLKLGFFIFKIQKDLFLKICLGILLALLVVLMRHTIFYYLFFAKWSFFCFFVVISFFIGFFLVERNIKAFVYLFIFLNVLNVAKIVHLTYVNTHNKNINQSNLSIKDSITIKNKNNIFFILMDSFTSMDGLRQLGMQEENQSFLTELAQNGFIHYPSFYTSSQPTTFALFSYVNLSHSFAGRNNYFVDDHIRSNHILGGGELYKLLRENHYKINILHESDFFAEDLCSADMCFFSSNYADVNLKIKVLDIIGFLLPLPNIYQSSVHKLFSEPTKLDKNDQQNFLQSAVEYVKTMDLREPNFTYFHAFSQPTHTGSDTQTVNHCNEEAEIFAYRKRVRIASLFVLKLTKEILAKDKNAIIIVAGDHGPYIFRKCTRDGIYKQEEIIERQGAFLSIHWGKSYHGQYDQRIKSSHNLFRYILSYLAHNENLLSNADRDNAYTKYGTNIALTIDDGKMLF